MGVCEFDEQAIPIRMPKIATMRRAVLKLSTRNCCLLPMEPALFANGNIFKVTHRPRFITVSNSSAQLERRSMVAK